MGEKNETIVNNESKQKAEKMKKTVKNESERNEFLQKINKIYFYALIVSIVVILTLIGLYIDQSLKNNKQLCDNCGTNKEQLQTENKDTLNLKTVSYDENNEQFFNIILPYFPFLFLLFISVFIFFFGFAVFFYFQITKSC